MASPFRLICIARATAGFPASLIDALRLHYGATGLSTQSAHRITVASQEYLRFSIVLPALICDEKESLRSLMLENSSALSAYALADHLIPSVRLMVFDTDSTFINEEVIDEIAAFAGCKSQVAEITERAMRGELDFNAALHKRVALLAGLPVSVLEDVRRDKLSLTTGAAELTEMLHEAKVKTYLLSGGFSYFTASFRETLHMTGDFANELEICDGTLTGKTLGPVVNRQRKTELLTELAALHDIDLNATVAVGDGANDIDMCKRSGLGIAFCAKPALLTEVFAAVFERDLRLILHLIEL